MIGRNGDGIGNVKLGVWHAASRNRRNQNVEDGTDEQRSNDGNRHVFLRISRFLSRRAYGIETDIGEKHNPRTGHDSAPAEMPVSARWWNERMPVRSSNGVRSSHDKEQYHDDFHEHDKIIEVGRFFNPDDEQRCYESNDDYGRQVENARDVHKRGRIGPRGFDLV